MGNKIKSLYSLLLLPGLTFGADNHIVSVLEITSDSDDFSGLRVLGGYETDIDEKRRVGALQGFYEISDINGRIKFYETRGTYTYKVDNKSTVSGYVSALYTKDSHFSDDVGGTDYLNESWTTPIGAATFATSPTANTYIEAGWEHNIVDTTIAVGNHITVDTFSVSGDYRITNQWTVVGGLAYQYYDPGDLNKHSDMIATNNGYKNGTEAFNDYGLAWDQNLKGSKNIETLKLILTPRKAPGLVVQAKAKWFQADFNFKPGFLNKSVNGYDQFKRGVFWAPDRLEKYLLVVGYSRAFNNDNWVWSASYGYGTQRVNDHYGVGTEKVTYNSTHEAEEIRLKLRGAISDNLYLTAYYKQDADAGADQTAYRWKQFGINLEYSF